MAKLAKALSAAAGNAAGDPVYVEDVFSTYLYDGTGSTLAINNGIDLSDKGGLVWIKSRLNTHGHRLVDTARGVTKVLESYDTSAEATETGSVTAFNSNGFTVGNQAHTNGSGYELASWTFAKQKGFFDVVKFSTTGGGGQQTVSHNLGSIPGTIILKQLTSGADGYWYVINKNVTSPNSDWWLNYANLNVTAGFAYWGSTAGIYSAPTSSAITVSTYFTNQTADFIAYFFAEGGSDDQIFGDGGDEAIIKCGSYTGNSSTPGPQVNCGFEPQWVLIKRTSAAAEWQLLDNMRGVATGGNDRLLHPDASAAEYAQNVIQFNATGFEPVGGSSNTNVGDYMYVAIRRGPMKEPSAGTDVYTQYENNPSSVEDPFFQSSFPVDVGIFHKRTNNEGNYLTARLLGLKDLNTTTTGALGNNTNAKFDYMNGWYDTGGAQYSGYSSLMFRRYPKVFDVVSYVGNGVNSPLRVINHNLDVVPELVIIKDYTNALHWSVGTKTGVSAVDDYNVYLNLDGVYSGASAITATATTLTLTQFGGTGQINTANASHLALFFATLAGISKVGSYTGTGNDLNVDCGFSGGARFILIKRTGANGITSDWYVYDSVIQGIIAGNDPYWLMNTAAAEVTNTDYIDPLASGFTVTSNASSTINVSGGTYLFLAFA